jgi:hypothetical protein
MLQHKRAKQMTLFALTVLSPSLLSMPRSQGEMNNWTGAREALNKILNDGRPEAHSDKREREKPVNCERLS